MKKSILFLLLSFTLQGFVCFGQDFSNRQGQGRFQNRTENGKDKIRALYIAYITQTIQLTDVEAEKFWPIHREYEREMKNFKPNQDNEIEKEEFVIGIKKKYKPLFSNIIGNERSNRFFKKDKEFRDKLIERLRDKRLGNNRRGNGNN